MNSKSKIKNLHSRIRARARSAGVQAFAENLLVELCRIDTTPKSDIAKMRHAENRCFEILENELSKMNFIGAKIERRPINSTIQEHPNYSLLHFTKTLERPNGLSPEEAYAGRSNLVFIAPDQSSAGFQPASRLPKTQAGSPRYSSIALNAHIDVVAPFFPPRVRNGIIFGRGACDDKGPLVAIVAALKILSEILLAANLKLNKNVVAMFVVEEETGGNGSLSLVTDRELKKFYDTVLVGEPTSLKIHPANRGAVWYRAELKPQAGISTFEMSAFVIEELEREGTAIRAESRHGLFPRRPVQTCHGIIGSFGEHPSRICGEVKFKIEFENAPDKKTETLVRDCLESGLQNYIGLYGDKTKVIDSATKKPMVARHYDFRRIENGFEIAVHGATGHMGAIRERDGAITKTANLVRSLFFSKAKLEAAGGTVKFELAEKHSTFNIEQLTLNARANENLILEGGQGFLPTHKIEEIMARMRRAAERGAENYLRRCGRNESGAQFVQVTYEKLHNAAFDGDSNSPAMRNAIAAAKACKIWRNEPVTGWTVSCDARLFATEYPGMPVLTFGPGELTFAHSDSEQIKLDDMVKAAEFLALFLLRQTGTI